MAKPFETAGLKTLLLRKTHQRRRRSILVQRIYDSVIHVSTTRNAIGPSVSDPRTGEIIESDIIWYHNHLRSYRYLLETGAANPSARTLNTSEEEMGEMMRFYSP
jgi:hypothetical protein